MLIYYIFKINIYMYSKKIILDDYGNYLIYSSVILDFLTIRNTNHDVQYLLLILILLILSNNTN